MNEDEHDQCAICLGEVVLLGSDENEFINRILEHFEITGSMSELLNLTERPKKPSSTLFYLNLPLRSDYPQIIFEFNLETKTTQLLKGAEFPPSTWESLLIKIIYAMSTKIFDKTIYTYLHMADVKIH